jgi:hypothetical protein
MYGYGSSATLTTDRLHHKLQNPSSRQRGRPKTKSKATVRQKKGKRKTWSMAPIGCPISRRIGRLTVGHNINSTLNKDRKRVKDRVVSVLNSLSTTHWMGPRAGLDVMEERKFLTLPGLEFWPLGRPACSQSLHLLCCRGSFCSYNERQYHILGLHESLRAA